MKRLLQLSLLPLTMILLLGAWGCGDDDDDPTTPTTVDEFALAAELGDNYFTSYTNANGGQVNVTAPSVYELLIDSSTANDPYILDWRLPSDFALGHIEGAINVSAGDFGDVLTAIPSGKTVLNVCYTGQNASRATAIMNMLGIPAQNLKFGMCGWTSDTSVNLDKWGTAISSAHEAWMTQEVFTTTETFDYPTLSTGKTDKVEIFREAAIDFMESDESWTISVSGLQAALVDNPDDYFVINYFAPDPYNAGHIPGAIRYQPKQALRTDQMLANLPTDKTIVVYCYTGQTSAQVVAYLNTMGYKAKSLVFGVNAICHENTDICEAQYHVAGTDYPVVP